VSIAKSEVLSGLLKKRNVPHDVLNAKQHEREAEIVAQAGRKGRLTISTNMAGRGTDILLGGNPEFLAKREAGQEPNPEEIEGRLVQERVAKAKESGDGKFAPVTAAEVEAELARVHGEWKQRFDEALSRYRPSAPPSMTKWSAWAVCTSSAPSGTSPDASTTSCAAAGGARETRARPSSTCRSRTT